LVGNNPGQYRRQKPQIDRVEPERRESHRLVNHLLVEVTEKFSDFRSEMLEMLEFDVLDGDRDVRHLSGIPFMDFLCTKGIRLTHNFLGPLAVRNGRGENTIGQHNGINRV
jgi:hypothetical protein